MPELPKRMCVFVFEFLYVGCWLRAGVLWVRPVGMEYIGHLPCRVHFMYI